MAKRLKESFDIGEQQKSMFKILDSEQEIEAPFRYLEERFMS